MQKALYITLYNTASTSQPTGTQSDVVADENHTTLFILTDIQIKETRTFQSILLRKTLTRIMYKAAVRTAQ